MKAPALLLLALLAVLGIVVFGTGLWSPSAGTGGLPDPLPSAGVTMPALADEPVARRVAPPGAGFLDDSAPPNSRVEALNTQAKEALDGGRPAEAVLFLESAQALAPNDAVLTRNLAFAHYRVAETLMAAQDTEAAGAAFRRAWVLDDSRSAYGLHAASLRLRAFELSPALAQLDEVLARHPDSGNGQLMRGDVLNLLDRLEDSLAAYEMALKLGQAVVVEAAERGRQRTKRQLDVERDYVSEETAYFVIRHPPASDHLRLLGVLERARVEVCHALGAFPSHKALVVLYPPEAFRTVTGTHDWVGGLFDRKIRLPIADVDQNTDETERAFRHEFCHLMVSEWNPRCPTFVNEGLAQVVEYGRGRGLGRLVDLLDAAGSPRESLPALSDLPESFVTLADRAAVGLGYSLSYAFVDHVAERHGMGAVVRWIRALEQAPLAEAYQEASGRTLEHEEQLFRELVRTAP